MAYVDSVLRFKNYPYCNLFFKSLNKYFGVNSHYVTLNCTC